MNKLFILTLSLSLIFFTAGQLSASSEAPNPTQAMNIAQQHQVPGNISMDDWLNLKPREIAKRTGQKMGFFQRLMLKIVQKKMKKQMRKAQKAKDDSEPSGAASTSFILGIFAVLFLIIFPWLSLPLGIIAAVLGGSALARGDTSGLGSMGMVLGIIAVVVFFIMALITLSTWNTFWAGILG